MCAELRAAAKAGFSAALWGFPSVAPVNLPGLLATVGGINKKGDLRARPDSISEFRGLEERLAFSLASRCP